MSLLWQEFVEQVFTLPLFLEIVRGPLLHEGLQVVGVLLHAPKQVVQNVAALATPEKRKRRQDITSSESKIEALATDMSDCLEISRKKVNKNRYHAGESIFVIYC